MTDCDNLNFEYYVKQAFKVPFPKMKYNILTKEIEKTISSLPPKNSYGYGDFPVKIKVSSLYISLPLCHIFNKALSTGIFPSRQKFFVISFHI
jgi:hypothetical protein